MTHDTHVYGGSHSVDFESYNTKDLFSSKLKGETLCFGHIPSSKRAKFIQFLVDNGFVEHKGPFADLSVDKERGLILRKIEGKKYVGVYKVKEPFFYHTLHGGPRRRDGYVSAYRPTEYVMREGTIFITDRSSKIIDLGK